MTTIYTKFKVEGRGEFPADMLRHDRCFPTDSQSAWAIVNSDYTGRRAIWLTNSTERPYWEPTFARWSSFGWVVDRESVTEA